VLVGRTRDSEIEDLDRVRHGAAAADHDVRGLQVPVEEAEFMGLLERACDLPQEMDPARHRQRPFQGEQLGEGQSVDVFHGAVETSIGHPAGIEDLDGVRVAQHSGQARLTVDPGAARRRVNLHGDLPVQDPVSCQEDLRHAASADPSIQQVRAGGARTPEPRENGRSDQGGGHQKGNRHQAG
jgi:hypothetical protein